MSKSEQRGYKIIDQYATYFLTFTQIVEVFDFDAIHSSTKKNIHHAQTQNYKSTRLTLPGIHCCELDRYFYSKTVSRHTECKPLKQHKSEISKVSKHC